MKKLLVFCLAVTMSVSMLGCSKSDSKKETKKNIEETTMAIEAQEGISDSDYGTVELGAYKGVKADKYVYDVTEEDIDEEIEYMLGEYEEYNEVDRAAKMEDYVTVYMTVMSEDEVIYDFSKNEDEEGYEVLLGYCEFGEKFDESMVGAKKGDKLELTESFDDDYEDANLAGKKVDFSIEVLKVTEVKTPQLTEEFVKNKMGYESIEKLREAAKKSIQETNEGNSEVDLEDSLLQKVIDTSKFEGYSDKLFNICKDDIYAAYDESAAMWGVSNAQELMEMFELTEQDMEDEALNQMYGRIVVHQIAKNEKIEVTDKDYKDYVEKNAEIDGFESATEYEEEYGKANIEYMILQSKVLDVIKENAVITEVLSQDDAE